MTIMTEAEETRRAAKARERQERRAEAAEDGAPEQSEALDWAGLAAEEWFAKEAVDAGISWNTDSQRRLAAIIRKHAPAVERAALSEAAASGFEDGKLAMAPLVRELAGSLLHAVGIINQCHINGTVPPAVKAPAITRADQPLDASLGSASTLVETSPSQSSIPSNERSKEWRPVSGPEALVCGDVVRVALSDGSYGGIKGMLVTALTEDGVFFGLSGIAAWRGSQDGELEVLR